MKQCIAIAIAITIAIAIAIAITITIAIAITITIAIAALLLFLLYYILAALHFGPFRHMLGGMPSKVPIEKHGRHSPP